MLSSRRRLSRFVSLTSQNAVAVPPGFLQVSCLAEKMGELGRTGRDMGESAIFSILLLRPITRALNVSVSNRRQIANHSLFWAIHACNWDSTTFTEINGTPAPLFSSPETRLTCSFKATHRPWIKLRTIQDPFTA